MSALRALRQTLVNSSRAVSARPIASMARSSLLPAFTARAACVPITRTFTMSARRLGDGTTDISLTAKLGEELAYEKEAAEEHPRPDVLAKIHEEGIWTVIDTPGNDEVTITRQFGNETIRLMFSIADIQTAEDDPEYEEEVRTENEVDGENRPNDEALQSYPIRVSLSITKNGVPGALNLDTLCQEGTFIVENLSFYADTKVGTELTAESDWKRRGLYIGPQFETLDIGVQEEFEKYLQERGINENLALFIPEYAEHKEQAEYTKWLENVKNFIEL